MKRMAMVLVLLLLMSLITGCGAQKTNSVTGSDGEPAPAGQDAATKTDMEETEAQPEEAEYVTLTFEENTASAAVDSVFLQDGKIMVKIKGTGFAFDGVLPMRDGQLMIPYDVDIQTGETTLSWYNANVKAGAITYYFEQTEWPEQIILYSSDNKEEKFVFDAAPFITETPLQVTSEDA